MLGAQSLGENVEALQDERATFSGVDRKACPEVCQRTYVPLCPVRINIFPSRYVNVGLFYLRQVFFARFDLHVHTHKGESFFIGFWTLNGDEEFA